MVRRKRPPFDLASFLTANGGQIESYPSASRIFSQGAACSCVFFIQKGLVRLTFASKEGKQATFALRGPGNFFGEECLAGQSLRTNSAITLSECALVKIGRDALLKFVRQTPAFSEVFIQSMVRQGLRQQESLTEHLLTSSEQRLARLLLSLASLTRKRRAQPDIPRISQALMAEMIGTTRGRVSFFMNKFRERGLIDYNGGLRVNQALLKSLLD